MLTLLAARLLPNPAAARAGRALDRSGLVLATAGLGLLTFGLVEAGSRGWTSGAALVPMLAAAAAFGALAAVERRAAAPVLPPRLVALPRVRASFVAAAESCFAFFGGMYLLDIWLQRADHLSPFAAGLAALPLTFPVCVMPFFTGRLVARHGARPVLLTGMAASAVAGVLLAVTAGHHMPLPLLVAAELALAATGTLSIPGAAAEMAVAAPAALAATGQGALNGVRQGGSALGVAVLGTLGSLANAGFVLVGTGLIGFLVIARGTTRRVRRPSCGRRPDRG